MKIEINDDYSDEITVQNLKDMYQYADSKKLQKALRRVIRFFSVHEEYKAWRKKVK